LVLSDHDLFVVLPQSVAQGRSRRRFDLMHLLAACMLVKHASSASAKWVVGMIAQFLGLF
jgi:hypothetical protein